MTSWNAWLSAPVTWSGYEQISRQEAIERLVSDGLIPLLHENGFVLAATARELGCWIATGLYKNRNKSCLESDWSFAHRTTITLEELDHYHHVFSPDVWDTFWSYWAAWSDLSDESFRGQDRRIDIAEMLWTQTDLKMSPQMRFLMEDEEADWQQSQQGKRGGEDHYLRDAAESGQWAGYRKTYTF